MEYIRRKKRKESHRDGDYIDNKTFQADLLAWYEASKEKPDLQIPTRVWMCVDQICKKLGTKSNFCNYSYNDEMQDAALEKCIKALIEKKYNPYRYDNPFAYFTTIAYYEFLRVLKDEQTESYIKHASLLNFHQEASLNPDIQHDDSEIMGTIDINWSLIEKFQPKKRAKKAARPHTAEEMEHLDDQLKNVDPETAIV